MQIATTTPISTDSTLIIGPSRPILCPNSDEVSLSNSSPPINTPTTYANDWMRLDLWGSVISLMISEWMAMFWITIHIWRKMHSTAKVLATSSPVKKDARNNVLAADSWLMTIQVFRLPYSIEANFYKKGADWRVWYREGTWKKRAVLQSWRAPLCRYLASEDKYTALWLLVLPSLPGWSRGRRRGRRYSNLSPKEKSFPVVLLEWLLLLPSWAPLRFEIPYRSLL